VVPGIMLASMYALFVIAVAIFKPEAAPALPPEARQERGFALINRVMLVMVPPLVLILVVLGSIFFGVATPTEAGALGALGAMVLAAVNRRLTMGAVKGAMAETTKLTSMVMMLLIGSTLFAHIFRGLEGDFWMEDLLTGLPGGKWGLIIVANLTIFVLGFFIDFFEIAFIILPLLVPAANLLGIDLVWFGVMIGMNLQTSFLTPPFGFSLFYLRGVAPEEMKTTDIYKGAIPFIAIQAVGLGLVVAFPEIVTWLIPG
jgi:tripartite ATP-independent transporter DctM subunit